MKTEIFPIYWRILDKGGTGQRRYWTKGFTVIDWLIYTETRRSIFEDSAVPKLAKLNKRIQQSEDKVENMDDEMRTKVKAFEVRLKNDIVDFRTDVQLSLEEKGSF